MKASLQSVFGSLLLAFGLYFQMHTLHANGLVISNTSLTGQNTGNGTWQVRFNVTWNNSWRDNINWDGVWIFCKYRVGAGPWLHATLSPTGHLTGTGTPIQIQAACDQKGAFITRRDLGSGTVTTTQVELRWHYAADGVLNTDVPDMNIYGMEMVYIPTGPFTIGDGNGVSSSATGSFFAVSQHLPYTIDALMSPNISASSNMTNSASNPVNNIRIDGDNGIDIDLDGIADSTRFPTGYNGFYIMKYKVTQGQYVDFLNSLTYTQQSNRVNNTTNVVGASAADGSSPTTNPNRNTIIVQVAGVNSGTPRVYSTARPDRANNYTNPPDVMAYLDWAALRPMSELEYEKSARGPLAPVLSERVWGNSSSPSSSITLAGTENGTETYSGGSLFGFTGAGTVNQGDGGTGPVRVGLHSTSSSFSRLTSGNSYYGVVNLGDNLGEHVVSVGNVAGRSYTGIHGDGILNANGHADVSSWPGANGNNTVTSINPASNTTGCTGYAGMMNKYSSQVSNRTLTTTISRTTSYNLYGGIRGVRDAFVSDWTRSIPNPQGVTVNTSNRFTAGQVGAGTTYSWSFPSGTPSSASSRTSNVTWSTPGTYNVTLTTTQGTCSATTTQPVVVNTVCVPPSSQSWTINNTTYRRGAPNSSYTNLKTLDGIADRNIQNSFWYDNITPTTSNPTWIAYDLGSSFPVSVFRLYSTTDNSWVGASAVGDFKIQYGSSISGPWTTVLTATGSGGETWQSFSFPSVSARYWKIEITSNLPSSYTYNTCIHEVAFWGCQ
jgi:formylglycine-generating enzyme required for sulfatase activity